MSLLKSTLKAKPEVSAKDDDRLGGGSFILDSDIYDFKITQAFLQKSDKGALGVFLGFESDEGKKYRETIYITGGDAKGNSSTYTKDGKEYFLPGYIQVNSLCLLTVGKELSDMEDEEKVVQVYDSTAKAEVPKKMPVMVELIGQRINVAIVKQLVNKTEKADDGTYVDLAETRETNNISKFFREDDKLTTTEITAGNTEPKFYEDWLKANKGKVINKVKEVSGKPGAPKPAGGNTPAKPAGGLFGKKPAA